MTVLLAIRKLKSCHHIPTKHIENCTIRFHKLPISAVQSVRHTKMIRGLLLLHHSWRLYSLSALGCLCIASLSCQSPTRLRPLSRVSKAMAQHVKAHVLAGNQCPFTLAPSRRLFMGPLIPKGRPPNRQRLNALMLWRAASKRTASSVLSSDCSRVISWDA